MQAASSTTHPRPVFMLDAPDSPVAAFAQWGGFGGHALDGSTSADSTPRMGDDWSPHSPQGLSPAEIALAAFEASRSLRKRSLTLESTSTSSSTSSFRSTSSLSSADCDGYLTPDTSVSSISPCRSPIELEGGLYEWPEGKGEAGFELERTESESSSSSSCASNETFVADLDAHPTEPLTRSSSFNPSSALQSRPLLARCLTAPSLGCSMVRSISTPVATQAAHDAALRDMKAGIERLEHEQALLKPTAPKSLDDFGEMRLEAPSLASLPWPYNRLAQSRDASMTRTPPRPGLSRAATYDVALMAAER